MSSLRTIRTAELPAPLMALHGPFRRAGSAVAILLATACTAGDEGADSGAQPDVPVHEGEIELEIGEIDGDDPYLFTSIGHVVSDEWGRVVVADMRTSEIRVFEPDGRFAFRFGGHGEGPGELDSPSYMEFGPDGALWVRENARFSVFTLDSDGAAFERIVRNPNPSSVGYIGPIAFDPDGRLIALGALSGEASGQVRFRVHDDGAVDTLQLAARERQSAGQTTVPFERGGFRGVAYLYEPFGPRWIHAHARSGAWAEAVTSEYAINYHSPDGAASLIEGPSAPGPPLGAEDREGARTRMAQDVERTGIGTHPFDIPDRKPPLAAMFFDRHERLWVEKTPDSGATMREADVYDEGALAARYRWPRRIRDYPRPWATDSLLYGVTVDSLGVQRVARVRFPASN